MKDPESTPEIEFQAPIIFLDIDGVLASARSVIAFGGAPHAGNESTWVKLDPVGAALIAWAAKETRARIVLSSSWRIHLSSVPGSLGRLSALLGLPPIVGVTRPGGAETRAQDIEAWIIDHPEVRQWAIVDDIQIESFLPHQRGRMVQVDPGAGLSLANAKHLKAILSGDTQGAWKVKSDTIMLLS